MTRFAPYGKKAASIRRKDPNRPRGGAPRTHAPFKPQFRAKPNFLFVYPPRNPSQKLFRAPRYSYAGASIALAPIHKKRRTTVRRKPKQYRKAKRVRFSRK